MIVMLFISIAVSDVNGKLIAHKLITNQGLIDPSFHLLFEFAKNHIYMKTKKMLQKLSTQNNDFVLFTINKRSDKKKKKN